MSEHDTACTCDRCRMMVMPTSRTVSGDEKVLYEWTDAIGDKFRMIDGPRPMGIGFLRSAAESDWEWRPVVLATTDAGKAILSLLCETRRLAALFDGEKILRARDTARVAELEVELITVTTQLHTECGVRDRALAELANAEAENAKLRKCVKAGDNYIDSIYSITSNTGLLHAEWNEKIDYYAARAEVDK